MDSHLNRDYMALLFLVALGEDEKDVGALKQILRLSYWGYGRAGGDIASAVQDAIDLLRRQRLVQQYTQSDGAGGEVVTFKATPLGRALAAGLLLPSDALALQEVIAATERVTGECWAEKLDSLSVEIGGGVPAEAIPFLKAYQDFTSRDQIVAWAGAKAYVASCLEELDVDDDMRDSIRARIASRQERQKRSAMSLGAQALEGIAESTELEGIDLERITSGHDVVKFLQAVWDGEPRPSSDDDARLIQVGDLFIQVVDEPLTTCPTSEADLVISHWLSDALAASRSIQPCSVLGHEEFAVQPNLQEVPHVNPKIVTDLGKALLALGGVFLLGDLFGTTRSNTHHSDAYDAALKEHLLRGVPMPQSLPPSRPLTDTMPGTIGPATGLVAGFQRLRRR